MKKFIVSLIATFMLASVMVALNTTSATSAARCPAYTGCIRTDTQVNAWSPKKRKLKVRAGVSAPGNAKPSGRIKVQVKGNNKYRQKVRSAPGMKVSFKIRPGIYLVQAKYIPGRNNIYRRSAESTIVRVKGRRR